MIDVEGGEHSIIVQQLATIPNNIITMLINQRYDKDSQDFVDFNLPNITASDDDTIQSVQGRLGEGECVTVAINMAASGQGFGRQINAIDRLLGQDSESRPQQSDPYSVGIRFGQLAPKTPTTHTYTTHITPDRIF